MKKMKYVSILALGLITLTSCGSAPATTLEQVKAMVELEYTLAATPGTGLVETNANYPAAAPASTDPNLEAYQVAVNFRDVLTHGEADNFASSANYTVNYMHINNLNALLTALENHTLKPLDPVWALNGKTFNCTIDGSYTPAGFENLGAAYYLSFTTDEVGTIAVMDLVVSVKGEPNTAKKDVAYLADWSFTVAWTHP